MTPDEKRALEEALAGLDYPAPRGKLVEAAKLNNAPPGVFDVLLNLPEDADFQDAAELRERLGIDVPGVQPTSGWE